MDNLRKYINLFESMEKACQAEVEEGFVPFEKKKKDSCEDDKDCDKEVTENTLTEFDSAPMDDANPMDNGLDGSLDPRSLAKLLPEVDDINRFTSAVRKVQKGDIPSLSISENRQLAKAFISLLMDDSNTTMKVLQKLRMIHTKDAMEGSEEDGDQLDEVFGMFGGKKKADQTAPTAKAEPRRPLTRAEKDEIEQRTGVPCR